MKLNKVFMSGLMLMAAMTASAQEPEAKTVYDFNPHWYIQGQVGGQYTLGEVKFKDLVSPNAQLAVGYNFTPEFGLRLAANAWQSRGGWEIGNNTYKWKYKYVAPGLDLMFNLSNVFAGFNPNRVFNVSAFVGAGANIGFDNDEAKDVAAKLGTVFPFSHQNLDYLWDGTKTRFFGRAGMDFDFRVSKAVSVGIEVNATALSDRYNSKQAGNPDWYFNALAGIKVNLGKTYTARRVEAPMPPQPVERIVERIVEKPAPAPEKVVEQLRKDVFFTIGKYNVTAAEETKVKEMADFLNSHPDAKVSVTGYADAGTGNNKINDRLAAQRAQSVVTLLRTKYGIAQTRITADSKGAYVQPFQENDKNRVSICIAE